jgi:hypothetical protein
MLRSAYRTRRSASNCVEALHEADIGETLIACDALWPAGALRCYRPHAALYVSPPQSTNTFEVIDDPGAKSGNSGDYMRGNRADSRRRYDEKHLLWWQKQFASGSAGSSLHFIVASQSLSLI